MIFADYTSAGWITGLVFGCLSAITFIVFLWWALSGGPERADVSKGWMVFFGIAGLVLTIISWTIASWPLKYDYHHYVEKSGVVQNISNRLVSGEEGIVNQRYVFVINGYPYGVDDTRAALAKKGDFVKLYCKKEHQFGQQYSSDGWGCRWGGVAK